jgi:ribonucleoside-diphosphate reductase alpha chain
VAIYRDGSKRSQPLNTKKTSRRGSSRVQDPEARINELVRFAAGLQIWSKTAPATYPAIALPRPKPAALSRTNSKSLATLKATSRLKLFEDGGRGELSSPWPEGSTIGGLMDTIGALTSGLRTVSLGPREKFAHQRFEPSGFTRNPDIRQASSIIDYVRWLAVTFIPG